MKNTTLGRNSVRYSIAPYGVDEFRTSPTSNALELMSVVDLFLSLMEMAEFKVTEIAQVLIYCIKTQNKFVTVLFHFLEIFLGKFASVLYYVTNHFSGTGRYKYENSLYKNKNIIKVQIFQKKKGIKIHEAV